MSPTRTGAAVAGPRCPICRRPADPAHLPFCGPRCVDIDLGRWLTEQYRVPTEEPPDDDGKE